MPSTLANALSLVGREALRIVLPSWCVACRRELPWRERTASCCADCWQSVAKIVGAKCVSCALPLPEGLRVASSELPDELRVASCELSDELRVASCELPGLDRPGETALATRNPQLATSPATRNPQLATSPATRCIACLANPLPLDWCDAHGEYRGALEKLVGALKFERHDFLDDALASLLEETMRERGDFAFDAIAPVPMAAKKERRRGYNQAELLGRALSRRVRIRCDMTLLTRRQERATQSTLPKRERAANVRGAFAASSRVKGKSILVVDDICTTGETLRACAAALVRGGAARVCALTVAKAS